MTALFFGLASDTSRFPFDEIGFGLFLVLVFALALVLFGRVD